MWKKSVDMVNIPLFTGFHTCRVVQDFFHQQYGPPKNRQYQRCLLIFNNQLIQPWPFYPQTLGWSPTTPPSSGHVFTHHFKKVTKTQHYQEGHHISPFTTLLSPWGTAQSFTDGQLFAVNITLTPLFTAKNRCWSWRRGYKKRGIVGCTPGPTSPGKWEIPDSLYHVGIYGLYIHNPQESQGWTQ